MHTRAIVVILRRCATGHLSSHLLHIELVPSLISEKGLGGTTDRTYSDRRSLMADLAHFEVCTTDIFDPDHST